MLYKTIVLELLRERTELDEQLRLTQRPLPTLEACSQQLKASHLTWVETLGAANPASDPVQIQQNAMELAIEELKAILPSVSEVDDQETLSLDAAMAFIRKHTPRG